MKIFLGYASERFSDAEVIYDFICALGHEVWFDKNNLVGGDDWDRERVAAQRDADFVVHLISSEIFNRAGVVNREIRKTLELFEDQPIGANYVVFIRLDDVRVPAEIVRFQYLDYFKETWQDRLALAIAKRKNQLSKGPIIERPETTTVIAENFLPKVGSSQYSLVESSVDKSNYSVKAEYIRYQDDGVYWEFVNARLAVEALEGFQESVARFNKMDDFDIDFIRRTGILYEWGFNMQEFFRKDQVVSIRSSYYIWAGGAHPSHGITTQNFLGAEHGFCSMSDLLGNDSSKAFKLLNYCKKVLVAMVDDDRVGEIIEGYTDDESNIWKLISQYNIDNRGITINFSPYDILPYVFGSHEVFVPWAFFSNLINEEYESVSKRFLD